MWFDTILCCSISPNSKYKLDFLSPKHQQHGVPRCCVELCTCTTITPKLELHKLQRTFFKHALHVNNVDVHRLKDAHPRLTTSKIALYAEKYCQNAWSCSNVYSLYWIMFGFVLPENELSNYAMYLLTGHRVTVS